VGPGGRRAGGGAARPRAPGALRDPGLAGLERKLAAFWHYEGPAFTAGVLARLALRPEETLVIWAQELPYEMILPFEDHGYLAGLEAIQIGCLDLSPPQLRRQVARGLPEAFRDLVGRPDVVLTVLRERPRMLVLDRFYRESYDLEPQFVLVFQGETFDALKVQRAPTGPSPRNDEAPGR